MSKQKNTAGGWFILIGVILFLITSVLLIARLTNGNIIISGNYPDPKTTQSLNCNSQDIVYPFFPYDNSQKKKLTINATFNNGILTSAA